MIECLDSGKILPVASMFSTFDYHTFATATAATTAPTTAARPPSSATPSRAFFKSLEAMRVVGKGAFAKVLLVRQRGTDRCFALKIMQKRELKRRRQVKHTLTERRVLARVEHPFIIRLHSSLNTKRRLLLVMDYCAGGELFYHLTKVGSFSHSASRFYVGEIALALEHLHAHQIVYRDLKPENVLLDADGHVKLCDFGLAAMHVEAPETGAKSFCGTPEYLAPETIERKGHGHGVDWWALGMMLFEMLTGLPPFYSRHRPTLFDRILHAPLSFPPVVSMDAREVIRGLLDRQPTARWTAKELKQSKFFSPIDWQDLTEKQVCPPFKPLEAGTVAARCTVEDDEKKQQQRQQCAPDRSPAPCPAPETKGTPAAGQLSVDEDAVELLVRNVEQHIREMSFGGGSESESDNSECDSTTWNEWNDGDVFYDNQNGAD